MSPIRRWIPSRPVRQVEWKRLDEQVFLGPAEPFGVALLVPDTVDCDYEGCVGRLLASRSRPNFFANDIAGQLGIKKRDPLP